jgi:hypothetical protein
VCVGPSYDFKWGILRGKGRNNQMIGIKRLYRGETLKVPPLIERPTCSSWEDNALGN